VASAGVLVNDSDPDAGVLSAQLVQGPARAASFQLNSNGSFNYTPHPYFCGDDTFTYLASDGADVSQVTTVHITVKQPGSQGFITGGGKFFLDGGKRTFGLVAKVEPDVHGELEFQDHDAGLTVQSEALDVVYAANATEGYFSGSCTFNGEEGYTFFVQVHDGGEPGSNDQFAIWVSDASSNQVYAAGAGLAGGNITIHAPDDGGTADSDGDGLTDDQEPLYGTDPEDADSDDDLLSDGEEVLTYGTDPLNVDTDGDCMGDGEEVLGLIPTPCGNFPTNPLSCDTDGDQYYEGCCGGGLGSDCCPTDPYATC
jgi:hypothetical protein